MVFGSSTSGRIELVAGTEVSPVSTSVTDSAARVGGGFGVCGGDATFRSGEFSSEVDSGRGDVMEEWVCLVLMGSLREKESRKLFG